MSKFYDVICSLRRELVNPRGPDMCIVSQDELAALIESAELIYEVRNEKKHLHSMPASMNMAIRRIEDCANVAPAVCKACGHE